MRSIVTYFFLALVLDALMPWCLSAADMRPSIVFVLCDDLGYGDVHALNSASKIATPHLDKLASAGMAFTDAHSPSAVCTPSRYGLLTGRYAWRSRLQQGVLGGLSPRLIEPGRMTVASLLKSHGYHTACIGKWHLGMNWAIRAGKQITPLGIETADQVWSADYSAPIGDGPNALGFDEYFGVSASLDMVPYTFIRNTRVTIVPTVDRQFPMVLGESGQQTRRGPAAPDFDAGAVLPTLTRKAVEYIAGRAEGARKGNPFFLYLPLTSPHTPICPSPEWQGKSRLNAYADFVMQTDACIGRVLEALDDERIAGQTLVIVTSDNGCSPAANMDELEAKGHHPSYVFRGAKADIYEGGHRVAFLVRWPGRVHAGALCDRLTCLTDILATCADILGVKLPETAGEDSVSFLPALLGAEHAPARAAVVHHSINGSFAIRDGTWKLAFCADSGGWSEPRPELGDVASLPQVQLFDLGREITERKNVAADRPNEVTRLTALMMKFVSDGRSTPGATRPNSVPVAIWKNRKP
jgi:arylsulfatase A-like enzyme